MQADDLSWRVERACLNAWPATRQLFVDGWKFRASGGATRRTNSANPLHAAAQVSDALIDKAEAFYRDLDQPVIFRVPDIADGIDDLLEKRGYSVEAPTRTLFAPLDLPPPAEMPDRGLESGPSRRWLNARDRLSGSTPDASRAARTIIGAILLPRAFASVTHRGRIVALGFAVRQDDLLILESVMTDPVCRRRGFGRQCVSALMRWGASEGCRGAALQVMADNDAALALYAEAGFTRDLYGYHYRIGR